MLTEFVPQVLSNRDQYAAVDIGTQAKRVASLEGGQGKLNYQELKERAGVKDKD
jgi:hypothetical protein